MNEPKIIKVKISALIKDPNNPNKMTDEEFAALCRAVKEHGMLQPILVQEADDGYPIVDGHHRTEAAELAGHTHILAVVWDGTEAMRKAFAIGMNKIKGELDLAAVQRTIAELHAVGWSVPQLTITGYTEEEISDLLKVATDVSADDIMENPVSPPEEKAEREPRPLVLELTFSSKEELQKARRGLRRAAGTGRELGEGLLILLGQKDQTEEAGAA